MIDLNNLKDIQKIDQSKMLLSIESLPDQCLQAWNDIEKLPIPDEYKKADKIITCAMGGSALGVDTFNSLYGQELKTPLIINNNYQLPAFVNQNSLVILSSYSGSTEEVLNCAEIARKKKAKIFGMTTGGILAKFLKTYKYPGYIFSPKFNPGNQPRMGNGYSVLGLIAFFNRLNFININDTSVFRMISFLTKNSENIRKQSQEIAKTLKNKIPIIFASSFLSGNAHTFSNQINENSKNFSGFYLLPELNHHLLEGFAHPDCVNNIVCIFLESDFYSKRINRRIGITKEILAKQNINFIKFKAPGDDFLTQSFTSLLFSSFVSFYLSVLYNQDPGPNIWVDYFKQKLS